MSRHTILICRGVDCHARGRQFVEEALGDELGIRRGQSRSDRRFSMQLADCLDICERAPAIRVDDDYYGPVHPDELAAILSGYA